MKKTLCAILIRVLLSNAVTGSATEPAPDPYPNDIARRADEQVGHAEYEWGACRPPALSTLPGL